MHLELSNLGGGLLSSGSGVAVGVGVDVEVGVDVGVEIGVDVGSGSDQEEGLDTLQ